MKKVRILLILLITSFLISSCTAVGKEDENRLKEEIIVLQNKNDKNLEIDTNTINTDKIQEDKLLEDKEKDAVSSDENLEPDKSITNTAQISENNLHEDKEENEELSNAFILPDINETKKIMEKYVQKIKDINKPYVIVDVIDNLGPGKISDKTHEITKSLAIYAYLCDLKNSIPKVEEAKPTYDNMIYRIDARVEYYFDSDSKLVKLFLDSGYRDHTIDFSEEIVNSYQDDISALDNILSYIQKDLENHFSISRLDYFNPKKSYSNGELARIFTEAGNMGYITYRFIPNKREELLTDEQIKYFITEGWQRYLTIAKDPLAFIADASKTICVNDVKYYLADKNKLTTYLTEVFTPQMCEKFFNKQKDLFVEDNGQLYIIQETSEKIEKVWREIVVKSKEPLDRDTIAVEVYLVYPGISENSSPSYGERKFEFKYLEGQGWWLNSW